MFYLVFLLVYLGIDLRFPEGGEACKESDLCKSERNLPTRDHRPSRGGKGKVFQHCDECLYTSYSITVNVKEEEEEVKGDEKGDESVREVKNRN